MIPLLQELIAIPSFGTEQVTIANAFSAAAISLSLNTPRRARLFHTPRKLF